MRLKERFYTSAARMLPPRYREHISGMLVYAGEDESAGYWLGSGIVLGILVWIGAVISPLVLMQSASPTGFAVIDVMAVEGPPAMQMAAGSWIIGVLIFILIQLVIYLVIYFKVHDRTKRVEKALPDALLLMAANIRAGMTPFQAMKLSARKEFGPLSEEIGHATSRALGTGSFSDALMGMSHAIKSPVLDRAMQLFSSSLKAGGHLAQLLEELSKDISATQSLKKELKTNTQMYTMLIIFTIILGAPVLQAVSIHFVKIIAGMQAGASTGPAGFGMSFLAGELTMTPGFLAAASVVMLVLTSIMASMLVGVIAEGKEKYGLKYAPLIIALTLIVFVIAENSMGGFLGGVG